MRKEFIDLYINLIERFLEKKINVKIFEGSFLDLFHENANDLDSVLYDTIEYLFYGVEAYTDILSLLKENPDRYIDEKQLRESAAKTLQKLQALK